MLRALGHAQRYAISRIFTHRPFFLAHSLTTKCNCKCRICPIWREKNGTPEMKTREILRMLDEARKLNFVAYIMFGGEPLLRTDALDILGHAHDLGLYTSIITNGVHLPQKANEIAKAVDLTWVSLDYCSNYHDEMRGLKGTFNNAIRGIVKLRNEGGKIAINCVLSKLNKDVVGKMAELAHNLRIKVAFDPMEVFAGVNEEYSLSHYERRRLFSEVWKLKKLGYPILNSYEFLDQLIGPMKYSCAQPKVLINVNENGDITPFWCQKSNRALANLRKQSLEAALHSNLFEEFTKMTDGCNHCTNSTTVEVSAFYSHENFLKNCVRMPNPIGKFIADYM